MVEKDIIIIGSGVAGMSAASYSARAGRSTLVLESLAPGGQCMYIDMVENYPGMKEPLSGFAFAEGFEAQAKKFGAETAYAEVKSVEKQDGKFIIATSGETYQAKAVIIATGAKHRHLGAKGEDQYQGRGVSYCGTCDGPLFRGKSVIVVGGGDTALSDALYLSKLTDKLTICHRKDRFRGQEGLIAQLKSQKGITYLMESTVEEILGDGKKVTGVVVNGKEGKKTLAMDGVFIFVGMMPQSAFLDKSLLDDHGYIPTNRTMESREKGLFAAGDVRDTPFRQLITAASDGAIAAHAASAYIDSVEGNEYR